MTYKILLIIQAHSKSNPISRRALSELTGLGDRAIRNTIGDLREKGYRICSTSRCSGYYMAKTPEDYLEFRREFVSRGADIFKKIKAMDARVDGQISIKGNSAAADERF